MTIEVTGCHDCPFCTYNGVQDYFMCLRLDLIIPYRLYLTKEYLPSCPLNQETITIKLKSDEKQ